MTAHASTLAHLFEESAIQHMCMYACASIATALLPTLSWIATTPTTPTTSELGMQQQQQHASGSMITNEYEHNSVERGASLMVLRA